jgi:copper transport protein
MLRRRTAYLLLTLILAAIALVTGAPSAFAHATLESTLPAEGSTVAVAPTSVSATFDEAVGVSPDSLRVFAPNGQQVDTGGTIHGRVPQQIVVNLVSGLGRGTYTVGWHVISADSHPVQGAFTFSIGAPSTSAVTPASLQPPASKIVTVTFGAVRGIAFGAFALMIGVVAFVLCCWPAGASRPGIVRLALTGWGALTAATLGAILLQGVYGAGQGIGHLFWPDVLHQTLYSGYGRALAVRLLLEVAALVVFSVTLGALPAASRRVRGTALAAWAVVTAGLAATWAIADHAGTGMQVPLSVPSDIIHLSAMSVWIGGLVTLITVVLRNPEPEGSSAAAARRARRRYQAATADAAVAVSRFSPIALCCVGALVATGTYQAWRGVGTFGALFGTTYGRLLLVKIGALCGLVALGNLARVRLRQMHDPVRALLAADPAAMPATMVFPAKGAVLPEREMAELAAVNAGPRNGSQKGNGRRGSRNGGAGHNGAGEPDAEAQFHAERASVTLRKLRWSVTAEVAIATAVLTVTAILVNTPTARETYKPPATVAAAFDTGGPGGTGTVSVVVTPDQLGPNQVRLSLTTTSGQPYQPAGVIASLALPDRNLGPLPVQLTAQRGGVYVSAPVVASFTGQWQLRVTIRSDAFDETTVVLPVPIR